MDEKFLVAIARHMGYLQLQIRMLKIILQHQFNVPEDDLENIISRCIEKGLHMECGNVASWLQDFISDADAKGLTLDQLIEMGEKQRGEGADESGQERFEQLFREMWGDSPPSQTNPPEEDPPL